MLLSDGLQSFRGRLPVSEVAALLRSDGVEVFSAILGDIRNVSALSEITYSKAQRYLYSAKNLRRLPNLTGAWPGGKCDDEVQECTPDLDCGLGYQLCSTCVCPSGAVSVRCLHSAENEILLSEGAIAGIIVASAIALVFIAIAICLLVCGGSTAAPTVVAAGPIEAVQNNPLYRSANTEHFNPSYKPSI